MAWAVVFALLGSYGYRPKLTPERLLGYRGDGSTFAVESTGGLLPMRFGEGEDEDDEDRFHVVVRDKDAGVLRSEVCWFASPDDAVTTIKRVLSATPVSRRRSHGDASWRHFPPRTGLDRIRLGITYATYRPYLDALAARGIHAYVEAEPQTAHRIYADISEHLLLDVSVLDEGIDELGPGQGYWVVFVTGRDGNEAEVMVEQADNTVTDSEQLAATVVNALASVLRDQPILLGTYDPHTGRLDPGLVRAIVDAPSAAEWPPRAGALLPGAGGAHGVNEKLAGYSLKLDHERGGAKAQGFAAILGITADDLEYLASALLAGIQAMPVSDVRDRGEFGMHCTVLVPVRGLRDHAVRIADVVTAWEIRAEGDSPRLITAYVSSRVSE